MHGSPRLVPLRIGQQGLRGQTAHLLVEEPTDESYWPVKLPAGTQTVKMLDDTPNQSGTVRVHPVDDPTEVVMVYFNQLALADPLPHCDVEQESTTS